MSGVVVDPGECFLVKLEQVVLGPRNAGLANSTKHKPSGGGRAGDGGTGSQRGSGCGKVSEVLDRGGEVRRVSE